MLEIVAEQTGYPTDLLDPDLDLEADLGIDTVKQAEVFAAIRESYAIERDDSLKLRDYPTLRHVVQLRAPSAATARGARRRRAPSRHRREPHRPSPRPAGRAGGRRAPSGAASPCRCCVRRSIAAWRTGVELAPTSRVLLMPDRGGVAAALAGRLKQRGVTVLTIDGQPAGDELEETLARWTADGPIAGVYWLAALDDEGPLEELEPGAWRAGLHVRVEAARSHDARARRRRLTAGPRSWSRRPGWAAVTATTSTARPRSWAARSAASARRSPASASARW